MTDVTAFLLSLSLINEIFIRKLKTFGNHLKNRRSKGIIVIKIVSRDYFFVSKEEFEKEIENGGMLEYAKYVDNYYGTPLKYVNEMLDQGKDVFLEIEVKGAMQVREKVPDGLFIFLTPPDLMELRQRIINRGTDDLATIDKRMEKAVGEIEMMQNYDYAVVNDEVPKAAEKIQTIIRAERWRVKRFLPDYKKQLGLDDDQELDAGALPLLNEDEYKSDKNVGKALEEVEAGKLTIKGEN